ncbi:MAG: response regulator transcription factor [Chloroflexota bacterium]|jgi:two-component system KDP operon response regulator KdpE
MNILVIDDDPAMTELLAALLQTIPAKVIAVNSGQEGIDRAQQHRPDIVILDLMMPEMDGWQVCKKIREFSNVPILILSALDHPGMVATALDAGADDYLIKPVSSGMLIARINTLLRRSKTIQPGVAAVLPPR